MKHCDLQQVFMPAKLIVSTVKTPAAALGFIPAIDSSYVFNEEFLNNVLLFLDKPLNDALYIAGPSGCGKTSAVLQIAARLKWSVEQVTFSNRSEVQDLLGHFSVQDRNVTFNYGPLSRAMLNGSILLLNEIDLVNPGDLALLNDVIEGRPLCILQNGGEIVFPHPFFRVIATANTKGSGDESGFYNGTRILNQAFLDRWRFIECSYPDEKFERILLKNKIPGLNGELINKLLQFALELRRVSTERTESIGSLSAPFSTRVLLRLAGLLAQSSKLNIYAALDLAYASRLSQIEREYVKRLCFDVFGSQERR